MPATIKPVYRNGYFVGFCVVVKGEAVGCVLPDYNAALSLLAELHTLI